MEVNIDGSGRPEPGRSLSNEMSLGRTAPVVILFEIASPTEIITAGLAGLDTTRAGYDIYILT